MKFKSKIDQRQFENLIAITVLFTCRNKMLFFPITKTIVYPDGTTLKDLQIKIICLEVGKRLIVEIEDHEKYESDLEVFRIQIR